jgi:hypothetical protein
MKLKKIAYMEHHTRGKLNEQVQVEKVKTGEIYLFFLEHAGTVHYCIN